MKRKRSFQEEEFEKLENDENGKDALISNEEEETTQNQPVKVDEDGDVEFDVEVNRTPLVDRKKETQQSIRKLAKRRRLSIDIVKSEDVFSEYSIERFTSSRTVNDPILGKYNVYGVIIKDVGSKTYRDRVDFVSEFSTILRGINQTRTRTKKIRSRVIFKPLKRVVDFESTEISILNGRDYYHINRVIFNRMIKEGISNIEDAAQVSGGRGISNVLKLVRGFVLEKLKIIAGGVTKSASELLKLVLSFLPNGGGKCSYYEGIETVRFEMRIDGLLVFVSINKESESDLTFSMFEDVGVESCTRTGSFPVSTMNLFDEKSLPVRLNYFKFINLFLKTLSESKRCRMINFRTYHMVLILIPSDIFEIVDIQDEKFICATGCLLFRSSHAEDYLCVMCQKLLSKHLKPKKFRLGVKDKTDFVYKTFDEFIEQEKNLFDTTKKTELIIKQGNVFYSVPKPSKKIESEYTKSKYYRVISSLLVSQYYIRLEDTKKNLKMVLFNDDNNVLKFSKKEVGRSGMYRRLKALREYVSDEKSLDFLFTKNFAEHVKNIELKICHHGVVIKNIEWKNSVRGLKSDNLFGLKNIQMHRQVVAKDLGPISIRGYFRQESVKKSHLDRNLFRDVLRFQSRFLNVKTIVITAKMPSLANKKVIIRRKGLFVCNHGELSKELMELWRKMKWIDDTAPHFWVFKPDGFSRDDHKPSFNGMLSRTDHRFPQSDLNCFPNLLIHLKETKLGMRTLFIDDNGPIIQDELEKLGLFLICGDIKFVAGAYDRGTPSNIEKIMEGEIVEVWGDRFANKFPKNCYLCGGYDRALLFDKPVEWYILDFLKHREKMNIKTEHFIQWLIDIMHWTMNNVKNTSGNIFVWAHNLEVIFGIKVESMTKIWCESVSKKYNRPYIIKIEKTKTGEDYKIPAFLGDEAKEIADCFSEIVSDFIDELFSQYDEEDFVEHCGPIFRIEVDPYKRDGFDIPDEARTFFDQYGLLNFENTLIKKIPTPTSQIREKLLLIGDLDPSEMEDAFEGLGFETNVIYQFERARRRRKKEIFRFILIAEPLRKLGEVLEDLKSIIYSDRSPSKEINLKRACACQVTAWKYVLITRILFGQKGEKPTIHISKHFWMFLLFILDLKLAENQNNEKNHSQLKVIYPTCRRGSNVENLKKKKPNENIFADSESEDESEDENEEEFEDIEENMKNKSDHSHVLDWYIRRLFHVFHELRPLSQFKRVESSNVHYLYNGIGKLFSKKHLKEQLKAAGHPFSYSKSILIDLYINHLQDFTFIDIRMTNFVTKRRKYQMEEDYTEEDLFLKYINSIQDDEKQQLKLDTYAQLKMVKSSGDYKTFLLDDLDLDLNVHCMLLEQFDEWRKGKMKTKKTPKYESHLDSV